MSALTDRIMAQLQRTAGIAVATIPTVFDVSEAEADDAIDELLTEDLAYRAGNRLFSKPGNANQGSAPLPAGPPRQVEQQSPVQPRVPMGVPGTGRPLRHSALNSTERAERAAKAAADRTIAGRMQVFTFSEPKPTQSKPEEPRVKTCSTCNQSKPLSEFYSGQRRCKACLLAQQRAAKEERRRRIQQATAAAASIARPTEPERPAQEPMPEPAPIPAPEPSVGTRTDDHLAVVRTPGGFRLGPLKITAAGLVHMPVFVDLSFAQLDELAEIRKGTEV